MSDQAMPYSNYSHIAMERTDGVLEMRLHTDGGPLVFSQSAHLELTDAFAAVARREIDLKMLRRLLYAVDRLPAMEIGTLRRFVDSSNSQPERDLIDSESIQAMVNAGLVSSGRTSPIGGGRTTYTANMTCQKFVELNLDLKSKGEQTVRP